MKLETFRRDLEVFKQKTGLKIKDVSNTPLKVNMKEEKHILR